MKRWSAFLLFLLLVSSSLVAGTTYYSQGNGFATLLSTWNTVRGGGGSSPADFISGDQFVVQNGHVLSAESVWSVLGGASITVESGGTLNINIGTVTTDRLEVQSGGSVMVGEGTTLTVTDGQVGDDLIVDGVLTNRGTISFGSGATGQVSAAYIHDQDGGVVPTMTWMNNSICQISGIVNASLVSGMGQSFYELSFSNMAQSSGLHLDVPIGEVRQILTVISTGSGSVVLFNGAGSTRIGALNLADGILDFTTNAGVSDTLVITRGDGETFRQYSGTMIEVSGSGSSGTFAFTSGDTSAFMSQGGTIGAGIGFHLRPGSYNKLTALDLTVTGDFVIDAGATFDAWTNVPTRRIIGSGNFILNPFGTLVITDYQGISTSGATGLVQVSGTRQYSTQARYVYSHSILPAVVGNGLPATVGSLTARCPEGLTIAGSLTVSDSFAVPLGTLDIGSNTLTLEGPVSTAGTGKIISGANGTVNYQGSSGQEILMHGTHYANLNFSNGGKALGYDTVYVSGAFTTSGSAYTVDNGNVFNFDGSGNQTVPGFTYANLTVSGSRGTNIVGFSSTDTIFISGDLHFPVVFDIGGGVGTGIAIMEFTGESVQYLPVLPELGVYGTVVVNKTGGSLKPADNISIIENLVLLNGTLDDNGYNITVFKNIVGGAGIHSSTWESGGIILSNGGAQNTIDSVQLGRLMVENTFYGASLLGPLRVKDLILQDGPFNGSHGVSIINGGSLVMNSGTLVGNSAVNFEGGASVTGAVPFYDVVLHGVVTFAPGSTVSHSLELAMGGVVNGDPLTYGNGSTLIYSHGTSVYRSTEWSANSGPGAPHHVRLKNNTELSLNGYIGGAIAAEVAGDLTVESGSSLNMNTASNEMAAPLVVLGTIINDGTLELSTIAGGYLEARKDFQQNGTLVPHSMAVRFTGTGTQVISKNGGGYITFDSLVIDNPDSVVMRYVNGNNLNINASLVLLQGTFYPEGASVDFADGTTLTAVGGALYPNNIALTFNGAAAVSGTVTLPTVGANGVLTLGPDVTIVNALTLHEYGSIAGNPPNYGPGSTLYYNKSSIFDRGMEWSADFGPGYPINVVIQNTGTLALAGADGGDTEWYVDHDLTISAGATLSMNRDDVGMTKGLFVTNNLTILGSLELSYAFGGDLEVGGNWTNGGTFTPNGRFVRFNGNTQTLTGSTTFDDLIIAGGATVSLEDDITVAGTLNLQYGTIVTGVRSVYIPSGSDVIRTSGFVVGNLARYFDVGSMKYGMFDVGETAYAPVNVMFPQVDTAGYLTVSSFTSGPSLAGSEIDPAHNVNRYWTVTPSGVGRAPFDAAFDFDAADVNNAANTGVYTLQRHDGTSWSNVPLSSATSTEVTASNIGGFGTFATGEMFTYTITASAGAGGTISNPGPSIAIAGSGISYTITPDAGYTISDVMVDGVSIGAVGFYPFSNIQANHTIDAYFSPVGFSINTTITGSGTVSPTSPIVNYGSTQNFQIVADPGYHVDSVLVDGMKTDSLSSYTFVAVMTGHTLDAYFSQNIAVTFSVDMRNAVYQGHFNPSTDSVFLRGDIAPLQWVTNTQLTDPDNDTIYTVLLDLQKADTLHYKYIMVHRGLLMWERETPLNENRIALISAPESLPTDVFDDLPPFTPVFGAYNPDANTRVLLHLSEDQTTGPTNWTQEFGYAAFDRSGYGNNGYRTQLTSTPGRFGPANQIGDTSHVVSIQDDPSLRQRTFTAEGWFRFATNSGVKVLMSKSFGPDQGNSFIVFYISGTLYAMTGNAGGGSPQLSASWTPATGKWYHIAYAVNGDSDRHSLFVNGVALASGANPDSIDYDEHPITLGAEHENGILSNVFDGDIDEFRFSANERSPFEFNVPRPPINVTANAVGTTMNLSWSNGGGTVPAAQYHIFRGTDSTSFALHDSATAPFYSEVLPSGPSLYYYRASTVDSTGYEGFQSPFAMDTIPDVIPPASPAYLGLIPGDGSITAYWPRSTEGDFSRYYLYRGLSPDPVTVIDTGFTVNDTMRTYTGLVNGQTYHFRLVAADTNGNVSAFTSDVSATPMDMTPPSTPLNVTAVAQDGQVSVSWTKNPEADVEKYYLYYGYLENPPGPTDSTANASDTTKIIYGLMNYTDVHIRIAAKDMSGNISPLSGEIVVMPKDLTPPPIPSGLTAIAGDGQVQLQWHPVADSSFALYYIYGGLTANTTTVIDSVPVISDSIRTIGGLSNGSQYYFRMTAKDTAGNISPFSFEVTATPQDMTPPTVPSGLMALAGNRFVRLRWNSVPETDFHRYRIYAGTSPHPTAAVESTTVSARFDTVHAVFGLTNSVPWYFRVTAVDNYGNESAYSTEISAVPSFYNMFREYQPDSATVLLMTMNESSGSFVSDGSLFDNNGSADVSAQPTSVGRHGYARQFDGSMYANISVPVTPSLSFGSGDFTAEMWMKTTSTASTQRLFFMHNGSTQKSWTVNLGFGAPAGVLNFEGFGTPTINGTTPLNDGQWHHIAAVRHNNTVTLFADGRMEGSGAVIGPDSLAGMFEIGGNNFNFNGLIDDVRLSSIARTPDQFDVILPPVILSAVPNGSKIALSWANSGGNAPLQKYFVFRGTDSLSMVVVDSSVTNGIIDSIGVASTRFYYRVAAADSFDALSAKSFAVSAVTGDDVPPAMPTNLASQAGDRKVHLHWNPNTEPDVAKYYIYSDTFIYPTTLRDSTIGVNDTTVTITGLTNGQIYYFRVAAVDSSGNIGPYSQQVGGMPVDNEAPPVPTAFTATNYRGQVTLRWAKNTAPDFHQYRIYAGSAFGLSVTDSVFDVTDTVKVLSALSWNNTYLFSVSSVDSIGNESPLAPYDAVTLVTEPGNARNWDGVDDYAVAENAALPQGNGPRTIEAWIRTTCPNLLDIVSWGMNQSGQRSSLVLNNGRLSFYGGGNDVDGARTINDGMWHHVAAIFDGSTMNLTVDGEPDASGTVTLATAGTVLRVARAPVGSEQDELFNGDMDELRIWNNARTIGELRHDKDHEIHGDEPGLVSYYRFDGGSDTTVYDNGPVNAHLRMSDMAAIIPSGAMFPAVPAQVTATAGDGSITLTWKPNDEADFDHYKIYESTVPSPDTEKVQTVPGNRNDTLRIFNGLENGTTHYFRVVAVDSSGNISPYSAEVSATPVDVTPPSAPQNLAVVDSIGTNFTLRWDKNPEADVARYLIYHDTLGDPTVVLDSTISPLDTVYYRYDLALGQVQYFRIAAVDLNGNVGPKSALVSATPYMMFQLTAFSNGGGTVTPPGTTMVHNGDSLQYTIHADPSYHIDSIAIDQTVVLVGDRGITAREARSLRSERHAPPILSDSRMTLYGTGNADTLQTFTFPNVLSDHTIHAYFGMNTYVISVAVTGNGYLVPGDSSVVFEGDNAPFCINPGLSDHLDSLLVDGVRVDSVANYTFIAVKANHSIAAYFSPNILDHFVVEADAGGPIGPQTAGTNFSIRTRAVDAGGNPVSSFTGNVWFSSTDTLVVLDGGTYSVPFTAGEHGPQTVTLFRAGVQQIFVYDSVSGKHGASAPFAILPAGLHHFVVQDTVQHPIGLQVAGRSFAVRMEARDLYENVDTLYAHYVGVSVPGATVSEGEGNTPFFDHGVLTGYSLTIETSGTFSIQVGDGLAERGGSSDPFVVVPATNPVVAAAVNGTISPADTLFVNYGAMMQYVYAPNPRHHFDSLVVDGMTVKDSVAGYTFPTVTGPHTITVYFAANPNIAPLYTRFAPDTAFARFDTLMFGLQAIDPDGGPIRFRLVSGPAGAVVDSLTGLVTYIPDQSANGAYPIVVRIEDDSLAFADDTVNVRVNIYGDVSGNGSISAFDGALVLQETVTAITFSPLQERVGDVTGNGTISAMDASYILQRAVGLISSFPGGLGKRVSAEAALSAFSFRIRPASDPNEYDLSLAVHKASNTYGLSMVLSFDTTIVAPMQMAKTALTDSMTMVSRFADGEARMAMAGIAPMNTAGDVIRFHFRMKDAAYPKNAVLFTMKKFMLNETDHAEDIGGITLNVHDLAQLPTVYKLEQNYPNPFNPSTTINYQLPEAAGVKVVIYNMLGQVVRTLVNEREEAGYYSPVWNGHDDNGRMSATGVYIYRIEALGAQGKRFTDVRKMLLVK